LNPKMDSDPTFPPGFSLAETMMAATLGALVLGGALDLFVSHHQHYRGQQAKTELQQELRGGVHVLARELRLAGTGILVGRPTVSMMAGE
jgi:Tfp pilus assembly protein PilW